MVEYKATERNVARRRRSDRGHSRRHRGLADEDRQARHRASSLREWPAGSGSMMTAAKLGKPWNGPAIWLRLQATYGAWHGERT